ncbi:MAG TPA: PIN domain-containing protein [Candidatus Sulfotelmatobacter sp.]
MPALVFVDTNVFVYYLDQTDVAKQQAARQWLAELWERGDGRISFQVLQEFYWTATRKWPRLRSEIQAQVEELFDWDPVVIHSQLLKVSWKIQQRYKISFWDSLIVAAAKAASCQYLLTEDLQPDQDLNGVVVVNPFASRPGDILS